MPGPDRGPDPEHQRPPEAPPEESQEESSFMDMIGALLGNMEDDKSRRRKGKRRRPKDDALQIDCLVKNRTKTAFEDVAGNEEAKGELLEIAAAIKNRDAYVRFGAALPKGILLVGGPGVGKTYMTGALANALNAPFYHVQVTNVTSMWFGKSEKNLAEIFDHARMYTRGEIDIDEECEVTSFDPDTWSEDRENDLLDAIAAAEEKAQDLPEEEMPERPRLREIREQVKNELEEREANREERYAIIFFDEIDALGACRENTPFQGGVSNRIVSVLLENMDGLNSGENILVIASTNRPEAVDSALRRAGRFDRIIKVEKPNKAARAQIFDIHFKKAEEKAEREFAQIDSTELAEATKEMVGADIAELVRKACQARAKEWRDAEEDDQDALDFILTDQVLSIIKGYRIDLRKKDPDEKGPMGFGRGRDEDEILVDAEDEEALIEDIDD